MNRRSVVISGGSRGLGLRLVEHFLQLGDSVSSFSRRPSAALDALQQSQATTGRYLFKEVDVSDQGQVSEFVAAVRATFGRVDILVNNAAVAYDGLLVTMPVDRIEQMMRVNLQGALFLTRECLKPMLVQGSGRIINITSIVGQTGYSGLVAYGSTKAALIGFTHALAREVGPRHITVNAVAPGFLDTDMTQGLSPEQRAQMVRRTPLGRLGTCEDVLPVVSFLASAQAGFITGQVVAVDGGLTS